MPSAARRAIAIEARAQMEKFLDYGLPLLHLDSHHHSHTDYIIAKTALPIAKGLGFKTVRLSRNLGRSIGGIKNVYKKWFNGYVREMGFNSANYFCGFVPAEVLRLADADVVIEMMAHPFFHKGKMADLAGELGDGCRPISSLSDFVASLSENIQRCTYVQL